MFSSTVVFLSLELSFISKSLVRENVLFVVCGRIPIGNQISVQTEQKGTIRNPTKTHSTSSP
jgi:hypothetical protein